LRHGEAPRESGRDREREASTRRYFEKRAGRFDSLYAPSVATRLLRRGPSRGRELAVSVVAQHSAPTVLDVGCGPGRVAAAIIEAGAARYVGVDFSPHMLALARERLGGFEAVELLEGDFVDVDIRERFDVVLALGLFDYLEEPTRAAEWMRARCSSTLLASFTRWDWVKAPIRHIHYELLHRCPISDYTEVDAEQLLNAAGFSNVEFVFRGRRGFFVSATPHGDTLR
jgi:SAM-dependent methyltransferase